MAYKFAVSFKGNAVGEVYVEPIGLYYRIQCRCEPVQMDKCYLWIRSGDQLERLGLLMPDGKFLVFTKSISSKKLSLVDSTFEIAGKDLGGDYVRRETEVVELIQNLPNLRYGYDEDNNRKIIIKDPKSN